MPMDPIEERRLAALAKLGILDTPPEERFDRLVRIARKVYNVKIALFSIVDEERQWFKAKDGLEPRETHRSFAFCDHAIRQEKPFIVEDASKDPRFRNNPLVTGGPQIRFYAGIPVREPGGYKLGTVCIIDDKPRDIREVDLDVLRTLASLIEDELERAYAAVSGDDEVRFTHITRAIQRAQNAFLTNDSDRAAFELMLSDLLAITGSQFGFIGEVLRKEDDTPYLKVEAITNIAWSPETQGLFQQVERRGMLFERLDNLLGAPMVSGAVVVAHDYSSDPRKGGLPPGHPPIRCYIGMPVYSKSEMIGLVGLANRDAGYTEEMSDRLAPLLQTVGTLLERKRLYRERQEHQTSLEKAANYDALTGLPNRRRLTELFTQELYEADQRKGTVSVCFLDLDGFKEINDEHGHSVGDAVLRAVAERLKTIVRSHDVIARLGGDEFVAILRDVNDSRVYSRILEAIRQPVNYRHYVLQLSCSMGITVYPDDDVEPDMLLRHADQAMYAAKEAGKNAFKMFDLESHFTRKERVRVLEQIGPALARDELELYFQPKVDFNRCTVEGFEALIRWNHPDDGLLLPCRFLDHIEYTEYASQVGRFVLGEAIKRLLYFDEQGLPYSISVNLSPSYFLGQAFLPDLKAGLGQLPDGIRHRLILEVLETTALDDTRKVIDILKVCQGMGVEVSMDDFGTGYSSLDYFRRLPVQEIKIDRTFVGDMVSDRDDEMVVKAILGLSKSFGRRVIAEGVESREVHEWLVRLGCDLGQGYFYAEPMPFDNALEWARNFSWPAM